jgi:hypothetical protein
MSQKKMTRTEISKKPNNEKIKVYAGGEVRTITFRQLKKNMGIPDRSGGDNMGKCKGGKKSSGSKKKSKSSK